MARKTEFELETIVGPEIQVVPHFKISIIGKRPENNPYVAIHINQRYYFIQDRDLERFAVNILKALGSKKLVAKEKGRKPWGSVCNKA